MQFADGTAAGWLYDLITVHQTYPMAGVPRRAVPRIDPTLFRARSETTTALAHARLHTLSAANSYRVSTAAGCVALALDRDNVK